MCNSRQKDVAFAQEYAEEEEEDWYEEQRCLLDILISTAHSDEIETSLSAALRKQLAGQFSRQLLLMHLVWLVGKGLGAH